MIVNNVNMMTRREALKKTGAAAATIAIAETVTNVLAQTPAMPAGPFTLPPLPYAFDALEPHIDAQTMQIHHGKHHQAYINNLNKAIADQGDWARKPITAIIQNLSAIPENIRTTVQNNGGGHANHSLFWQCLKKGGGEPRGELAKAIENSFGGFDKFKESFTKAAVTLFGSGWAWLSLAGRELKIEQTPNQDSPVMHGRQPLLGLDVWEHAYYLKHQNRRPDYVAAFYSVINWDFVSERYAQLIKE
jgi:Fe-Mn family superoxide dismutase